MSIELKSGASADLFTIDPTSKAGRVTLYDSAGNEIKQIATGQYSLPVGLRLTAAVSANSCVWAMRNGSSRTMVIDFICLMFGFDGTAATSTQRFELTRFTAANPTGGTVMTPRARRSTFSASTVQDARFNEGAALTVTGITFEGAWAYGGCQRQVTAGNQLLLVGDNLERLGIMVLEPNEGLAIRTNVVAVVGDSCLGTIQWSEYTTLA